MPYFRYQPAGNFRQGVTGKFISKRRTYLSIIIYTGRELTDYERILLDGYTGSVVAKGANSSARLLDKVCLFPHQAVETLPEQKKKIIEHFYDEEIVLKGKKILIVDDDMRAVFSLINLLEKQNMECSS